MRFVLKGYKDPTSAPIRKYVGSLPARFSYAKNLFAYKFAEEVLSVVKSKLSNPSFDEYADRIGVFWVKDVGGVFVGIVDYGGGLESMGDSVIAVVSGGGSKLSEFLSANSPWPSSMIPSKDILKGSGMVISYRSVSKEEAESVVIQRSSIESDLKQMLAADKVGYGAKDEGLTQRRDWAFDALRIEYGLPGAKQSAHWRPAIKSAIRESDKILSDVAKAAFSPKSKEYIKVVPEGMTEVQSTPKGIAEFMKKLGLRMKVKA